MSKLIVHCVGVRESSIKRFPNKLNDLFTLGGSISMHVIDSLFDSSCTTESMSDSLFDYQADWDCSIDAIKSGHGWLSTCDNSKQTAFDTSSLEHGRQDLTSEIADITDITEILTEPELTCDSSNSASSQQCASGKNRIIYNYKNLIGMHD